MDINLFDNVAFVLNCVVVDICMSGNASMSDVHINCYVVICMIVHSSCTLPTYSVLLYNN